MTDRIINININDQSPKANTAYVEVGKSTEVYNKEQVNQLIEDIKEGTIGSVSPSQTLTQLNALTDGNYYASEAGPYAFGVTVPKGWQYRFNKTGTTWKVLTKVEIPSYDDTSLKNRVSEVESKMDNFKVDVDEEFDINSKKSIANNVVSSFVKNFDGFKSDDADETKSITFSDITNQGYYVNGSNTVVASSISETFTILNYDITGYETLNYSVTSRTANAFILLGIKSDGTIVNIIPTNVQGTVYTGSLSLNNYVKITISSTTTDKAFKFNLIKKKYSYVDFHDFFNPKSDIFLEKDKSSGKSSLIFSNTILTSEKILSKDNTLLTQSGNAAALNVSAKDIAGKKIIVRCKRRSSSTPSGFRSVFLVVLDDNSIVNLIDYLASTTDYPTTAVEEIVISIPKNAVTFSTSTFSNVTGGWGIYEVLEFGAEGTFYKNWLDFVGANSNTNNSISENTKSKIFIPENSLPILNLEGTLPTDSTDTRTPTDMVMSLIIGGQTVVKLNSETAVQGNSTATLDKKGYSLALTNSEKKSHEITFNSWVSSDEFHLKAYHTDDLLTRDISSGRLWNKIISSRNNESIFVSNSEIPNSGASNKELFYTEATFFTDGFPVECRLNNKFLGVYILRQKKERANYRLDKDLKTNIQLEALGNTLFSSFTPAQWELRNPKLKDYTEGGTINDEEVSTSINRFFTWTKGILDKSIDFKTTYLDYIEPNSWIDFLIFNEVIYGLDSMRKNFHIITWDSEKWSINPYDMDLTLGYHFGFAPKFDENLILNNPYSLSQPLFSKIYSELNTEIKNRYKFLRDNNIISVSTLYNLYKQIPSQIGYDMLKDNYKSWGSFQENKFQVAPYNLQIILSYFMTRIKYLDSQWIA